MTNVRSLLFYSLYVSRIYKVPSILNKYFNKTNVVLFVTYHRILPRELIRKCISQRSMIVSLETFREQLKMLKKSYQVISIEEFMYLRANSDYNTNKPYAIINFDDGWADNYLFALEELKKMSLPAIIYLSSGFIGTNKIFWPEELSEILLNIQSEYVTKERRQRIKEVVDINMYTSIIRVIEEVDYIRKREILNRIILYLKEYSIERINMLKNILKFNWCLDAKRPFFERLLTWEEIRELGKNNISFGSHTHSHVILTKVPLIKADEEIRKSKAIIENELGCEICDFSYPNGSYNDRIINLVKKAGYRSAVSGINGLSTFITPVYELYRKGVNEFRYTNKNGNIDEVASILEWSDFVGYFRRIRKSKYH